LRAVCAGGLSQSIDGRLVTFQTRRHQWLCRYNHSP